MDNKALKEINETNAYTINGREYKIHNFTHAKRLKVFSYFSSVSKNIEAQDFGFMDTVKFNEIQSLIFNNTSIDDVILSKKTKHFEEHPDDFLEFILSMLSAISYPFLKGSLTD